MRLNKAMAYFLFFMITMAYSTIEAQDPVTIDYSPFERPKELAIIKTDSTVDMVEVIADTIMQYGFQITKKDSRDGIIEAQRADTSMRDCQERILIWLERDFSKPDEYVKLYFLYGKFAKIFGSGGEFERIKISEIDEDNSVGNLKTLFISL